MGRNILDIPNGSLSLIVFVLAGCLIAVGGCDQSSSTAEHADEGGGAVVSGAGFDSADIEKTLAWWRDLHVPLWKAYESGNDVKKQKSIDELKNHLSGIKIQKVNWKMKVDSVDSKWVHLASEMQSEPYDLSKVTATGTTLEIRRPAKEMAGSGASLQNEDGTNSGFIEDEVPASTYGPVWLRVGKEITQNRASKLNSGDKLLITTEVKSLYAREPGGNMMMKYVAPGITLVVTVSNPAAN